MKATADNQYNSQYGGRTSVRLVKKMPKWGQLRFLPRFLSSKERNVIRFLIFIIIIASAFLGTRAYLHISSLMPNEGGEYMEGFVGSPKFINPVYARANDIDSDITALVFASLIKRYDQTTYNDIADKYEISPDKKTYTFYLKKNIYWHDGEPLTAEDVAFTVKTIKDKRYASPLSASFEGVDVSVIDDYTVAFALPEQFAPFLSALTFGIIPSHIWNTLDASSTPLSEFNMKPIGSGPFKFDSLVKEPSGKIKSIKLTAYENYHLKKPYLKNITLKFYDSYEDIVEAINTRKIDGVNFLPRAYFGEILNKNMVVKELSLPQYTALFFNLEKNELLKDKKMREAIALAVDKGKLINTALNGLGTVIHGPILPGYAGYTKDVKKYEFSVEAANGILDELGWKRVETKDYIARSAESEKSYNTRDTGKEVTAASAGLSNENFIPLLPQNPLILQSVKNKNAEKENAKNAPKSSGSGSGSQKIKGESHPKSGNGDDLNQKFVREKEGKILEFNITTVDQEETTVSANLLKQSFGDIGVKTNLDIVPPETLISGVIEPRNYEMLLYGIIVLDDPDPYAVWHSSQAKSSGINLSMYKNQKADILMEQARNQGDDGERALAYAEFQKIIAEDVPAVFLYNSTYSYPMHKKIKGFNVKKATTPSDRFAGVTDWYIRTKRELKF